MVSGPAAGAGFCLALACDIRVASDNAFFTTGYRNVGLPGDYGGTWLLTKLIGPALAKQFYFTSEKISAQTALNLGIINHLTSVSDLEKITFGLAKNISCAPPNAIYNMKKNINDSMTLTLEEALTQEAISTVRALRGDEHKISVKYFMESRQKKGGD